MNKRVCLLSYQANHRKTFDVMAGLKAEGYQDVCVYAKPYHYTKTFKPIYEHRPSCVDTIFESLSYEQVILNYGYELRKIVDYEEISEKDDTTFLVCGAGILPKEFYQRYRVVNAHPGYIPLARGLDAFKWEIIEGLPIGVTTHLIGDYVDAGIIIERRIVPVFKNDSFHSLAYRVYFTEIAMLIDSIKDEGKHTFFTDGDNNIVHKRMTADKEELLMGKFDEYKKNVLEGDQL